MLTMSLLGAGLALGALACDDGAEDGADGGETDAIEATLGAEGGELSGAPGSAFSGFRLHVPAGALSEPVTLRVTAAATSNPLPPHGAAVGPTFDLVPHLDLARSARVTLPFDAGRVAGYGVDLAGVKVWRIGPEGWELIDATARAAAAVTVELSTLTVVGAGVEVP